MDIKEWHLVFFLRNAGGNHPLLLLLIWKQSTWPMQLMFTLVPNTTHTMQPLDTAVYGPLRTHWQDVCHDYIQKHPVRVIVSMKFSPRHG